MELYMYSYIDYCHNSYIYLYTRVDRICFNEESSCLSSDSSSLLLRGPRSSPMRFLFNLTVYINI